MYTLVINLMLQNCYCLQFNLNKMWGNFIFQGSGAEWERRGFSVYSCNSYCSPISCRKTSCYWYYRNNLYTQVNFILLSSKGIFFYKGIDFFIKELIFYKGIDFFIKELIFFIKEFIFCTKFWFSNPKVVNLRYFKL